MKKTRVGSQTHYPLRISTQLLQQLAKSAKSANHMQDMHHETLAFYRWRSRRLLAALFFDVCFMDYVLLLHLIAGLSIFDERWSILVVIFLIHTRYHEIQCAGSLGSPGSPGSVASSFGIGYQILQGLCTVRSSIVTRKMIAYIHDTYDALAAG
jgi:hypothetical protein